MSSPLAANIVDATALADELARYRLVEPERLAELLAEFPGGEPPALAEFLVQRGVLTPYQADRALAGETRTLVLGPYRLTGPGGVGVFGPLQAASHRETPGDFRIRLFPLRSVWRARQAKQLSRTFAAVEHAGVVPLVDVGSANGLHYLAWPHVAGETLADRVAARGPLPINEAIGILAYLAEVLHACHAGNLVHGALTPRAVLIGTYGQPRLLELGAGAILAANLADEESLLDTLSGAVAATGVLQFAAPEFVQTLKATPATDQYALGAIGYFALTGAAPFAAASLADALAGKFAGPPAALQEVNPAIPLELSEIIDGMLQTDPNRRFLGLDEVQQRLAELEYVPDQAQDNRPAPETRSPESEGERVGSATPPTPATECMTERSAAESSKRAEQSAPAYPVPPPLAQPAFPVPPWIPPAAAAANLPTRDDSAASIDFELPPPELEPGAAPLEVPAPAAETPCLRVRETETTRREDSLRTRDVPDGRVPGANVPPARSTVRLPSLPAGTSPASPDDPALAKRTRPDSTEGKKPSPRSIPEQRTTVTTPVLYHTEALDDDARAGTEPSDDRTSADSVLWRKVKRNFLFWQATQDVIQVSIYGPAQIAPGTSAKLSVFLHTPETADSVRTLARAFHHDSGLIGSGFVAREVGHETELGIHVSLTNAGISRSLLTAVWRGQPQRLVYDLHVPWESPAGAAPGLVSIGRDNVRIGKVEFRLQLLPRSSG